MPAARLVRHLCALLVLVFAVLGAPSPADAQEARPERRGKKYRVRIDSAPQQAAVYLDDERYGIVGYTPYSGSLQKGSWTVILKKDGYEVGRKVITVARRSAVQETFVPLVKKVEPGVIDVRADADQSAFGAQVFIDGQLQGQIPAVVNVPGGRHLVEIKKPDADTFSQWVEVKEGERVTVNPMLKGQAKGAILIDADVPEAEVFLDGNRIEDRTPTLINNVIEGPHIVEVRKDPAMPWKQSVNVVKGQTLKVSANLKASSGGEGGTIRVLSDAPNAQVSIDGNVVGNAPVDIRDVKPGQHLIEVKAAGHRPREESVTVAAGSALVLKMDLGEAGVGTIKVVSPLPESDVAIDGERLGPAPQEKSVSAGEHLIAVSKAGYAVFEAKVRVAPGKTLTVSAELKQVGGARFVSSPSGAEVLLDGKSVGTTPFVDEQIAAGEHVVTIRKKGFDEFQQTLKVEAAKIAVVNATLEVGRELEIEQRGLSAFGAKAMGRGRSIVGLGAGYPYFLDTRFVVGIPPLGSMAIDAGVLYRMYGVNFELGLLGRLTLINADPFSLSTFVEAGGGSALGSRNSKRNNFFMNAGAAASLTGLGAVTVTGRLYGAMWNERLCPGLNDAGTDFEKSKPSELCKDYLNDALEPEDRARIDDLLGGPDEIYSRTSGFRAMFSLIVEIAIQQHWSAWMLIDGTIFQEERAAYTDVVNPIMFDDDFLFYPRFGLTYKF